MNNLGMVVGMMALTAMMACATPAPDLETKLDEKDDTDVPGKTSQAPVTVKGSSSKTPPAPSTTVPATPTSPTAPTAPAATSSSYDALFAPASGMPNTTRIDGIWGTAVDGDGVAKAEARLSFHGDTLMLATRCTSTQEVVTVGVTVKANYGAGILDVLESKESSHDFDVGNGRTAQCRASLVGGSAAYSLADGKLAVLDLSLSKVADGSNDQGNTP